MPSSRPSHRAWSALLSAIVAAVTAVSGTAQDFDLVRPPIGLQGAILDSGSPGSPPREDPGRPVQMLESPNIDRFLRKAQDFLARDDFEGAIKVLQDVIEGRTLEDPTGETPDGEARPPPPDIWIDLVESAENAVFSADGRLYHPVRRLCHELLAALPPEGVAWYRARFEVEAERAFAEAGQSFDPRAFERVYERLFLTRAAGRALRSAADLLMDQGRLRAAIQAYRLLLEVYPESARREIGIDEAWIQFRIAACFESIGETARAREELDALVAAHPERSLRLQGELMPVRELIDTRLFAGAAGPLRQRSTEVLALRSPGETLVPLFEHRFTDPAPYRPAKGSNRGRRIAFSDGGSELTATPRREDYRPGTTVTFDGERLVYLDHFRVQVARLPNGHIVARNDGATEVPDPQPGAPRVRIPSYDFASLRVVADEARYYVVVGPGQRRLSGMKPVTRTTLEAWNREDLSSAWSTGDDDTLSGVIFLAAPTVFGARLLVPVAVRGTFGVMCFEGATGAQVYHVSLHRDGTDMTRPPSVPVTIADGIAYVLTNGGALGAIDAYTGTVRWIRRYERAHPFRPAPTMGRRRNQPNVFGGSFFQEVTLYGFAPSDLLVRDGLVVLAPCDGRVLICLDGTSGEPIWMVERDDMQYVIGASADQLFLGGPDQVTCIGLRTGVRLWRESLPPHPSSATWRGRGLVADGMLLVPGERAIHIRSLGPEATWRTLRLPALLLGREPLDGAFNLFRNGAYVTAVYESGIEVFSTAEALTALAERAEDPVRRAGLQAQAGDLVAAVATLEAVDLDAHPDLRTEVPHRMLALCGELSLALASHGSRDDALAMLDRCRAKLRADRLVERWHLARIEVFQALGDLDGVAGEQETLYELMGKRG